MCAILVGTNNISETAGAIARVIKFSTRVKAISSRGILTTNHPYRDVVRVT